MTTKYAINSIDVDLEDTFDKKGDSFSVQVDPEDDSYYCLIRKRGEDLLIVGFSKNKNDFDERIQNGRL